MRDAIKKVQKNEIRSALRLGRVFTAMVSLLFIVMFIGVQCLLLGTEKMHKVFAGDWGDALALLFCYMFVFYINYITVNDFMFLKQKKKMNGAMFFKETKIYGGTMYNVSVRSGKISAEKKVYSYPFVIMFFWILMLLLINGLSK